MQDGFLAQVELDHLGHIGVNRLVVGNAGADGVANVDMAGAVNVEQTGTAQRGGGSECQRVEEVIVHTPVNHIDAARPLRGAHVDEAVTHKQVLAFHQFHAHLLRQEGVLEISAVVHPRGEHHHRGFGRGRGAASAQSFQQQIRIVGHRGHGILAEQFGEQAHHHLAVFQHVADAAGHAQVVFQHKVLALALGIGSAHDVNAADVRVNVAGHVDAHHFGTELGVLQDLVRGDQSGLQNLLVVVDVVNEPVQRRHPLHQTLLHAGPLMGRNDARNQVEGDQAFGPRAVRVFFAVDREGDAHATKNHFGFFALRLHLGVALLRQPGAVILVMRPQTTLCIGELGIHFIKHLHEQSTPASVIASWVPLKSKQDPPILAPRW